VHQLSWDYKNGSSRGSIEEVVISNKQQPNSAQPYLKSKIAMLTTRSLSQPHIASTNSPSSPGIEVFTLTPNDEFVLIATRGLWEVMDSIEAVRLVGALYETQAEAVPEMLVREAQRRWKERGHFVEDVTVGLAVIST
jgi:serine/threonine protein phosphatase PrpC